MTNDHEVDGRDDLALAEVPLTAHQRQQRIADLLARAIGRMRAEGALAAHPDDPGLHLELSLPSPLDRGERGEDATRTGELPPEVPEDA